MTLHLLIAFTVSDDHGRRKPTVRSARVAAPCARHPPNPHRRACRSRRPAGAVRHRRRRCRGGGRIVAACPDGAEVSHDPRCSTGWRTKSSNARPEPCGREGLKWVEIMPIPAGHAALVREAKGKRSRFRRNGPDGHQTGTPGRKLRELTLTDEQTERLDALDAEIATLSEPDYVWSDRQKARAGAIVSVDHGGELVVLSRPHPPGGHEGEKS